MHNLLFGLREERRVKGLAPRVARIDDGGTQGVAFIEFLEFAFELRRNLRVVYHLTRACGQRLHVRFLLWLRWLDISRLIWYCCCCWCWCQYWWWCWWQYWWC